MIQPDALKRTDPWLWSAGRGTDVWAMFCACAAGDLDAVKQLIAKDPSLVRAHYEYRTPLAFAVRENQLAVADFLLEHGADIDTRWSSHEPASILHELVGREDYEGMQFLIDRGIDMTIKDYRWDSTAIGWARYGKHDEAMAQWLENQERERGMSSR